MSVAQDYISYKRIENGDPSQDVAVASVLFLVDGKLVLLQPSTNDDGELKYDMRVVAQNVEFYYLARDSSGCVPSLHSDGTGPEAEEHALRDSLWVFDGQNMRAWIDVQTLLEFAPAEYARELPVSTSTAVDFYPLSILMNKGILFGVESELSLGRDANFTLFRTVARVRLPHLKRNTSVRHFTNMEFTDNAFYTRHSARPIGTI